MNEDAARELIEFVGQLAGSVALLTRGMTDLMTVVEEKDREIRSLQDKVSDMALVKPTYVYGGAGGSYPDFSGFTWKPSESKAFRYELVGGGGGGGGSK